MTAHQVLNITKALPSARADLYKRTLGGSEIAAACGLNPWTTPYDLWMRKTGRAEYEPAGEHAAWGNILETIVRKEFEKRVGIKTKKSNGVFMRGDYSWLRYTPDGFLSGDTRGLYEGKTTNFFLGKDWKEGIPVYYQSQVQLGLFLLDLEWGFAAVLIGGQRLEYVRFERKPEMIDELVRKGREFWDNVTEDRAPPLTEKDDVEKYFASGDHGKRCEASQEILLLVRSYQELGQVIGSQKDRRDAMGQEIKAYMADAATLVDEAGKPVATWRNNKPSQVLDKEALAKEIGPEVFARFCTEKPGARVLRIK